MDKDERKKLQRAAKRRGVALDGAGGYERHILLCTGPNCCGPEAGQAVWKALGKSLRELKREGCHVRASQVGCLFLCRGGPLAVVYPEGTWYAHADEEGVRRIAEEHLRDGHVVEDLAFARNPLAPEAGGEGE